MCPLVKKKQQIEDTGCPLQFSSVILGTAEHPTEPTDAATIKWIVSVSHLWNLPVSDECDAQH